MGAKLRKASAEEVEQKRKPCKAKRAEHFKQKQSLKKVTFKMHTKPSDSMAPQYSREEAIMSEGFMCMKANMQPKSTSIVTYR